MLDQGDRGVVPVISEFGSARPLNGHNQISIGSMPFEVARSSIPYAAPEILRAMRGDPDAEKVLHRTDTLALIDFYSLGMTVFEMLSGKHPWTDFESNDIISNVLEGRRPPLTEIPDAGKIFIPVLQRLWHSDPLQRNEL